MSQMKVCSNLDRWGNT